MIDSTADYGSNKQPLYYGGFVRRMLLLNIDRMIDRGNKEPFQFKDLFDIDDIFKRKGAEGFRERLIGAVKKPFGFSFFMFMMNSVGKHLWIGGAYFIAIGLVQIILPVYFRWLL